MPILASLARHQTSCSCSATRTAAVPAGALCSLSAPACAAVAVEVAVGDWPRQGRWACGMKASHCRRRARCVGILSWHGSRLESALVSGCVQLHVVVVEPHSQRPTPRNPCDGYPCRIPLESACRPIPITTMLGAFLARRCFVFWSVLLNVDTGSKNHGRTMLGLVVNDDVERRDRRRAASLTGLRLAWSKGLQTLASSIRHGTWSL